MESHRVRRQEWNVVGPLLLSPPHMLADVLHLLFGDRLQQIILRTATNALEHRLCVLICRHHCTEQQELAPILVPAKPRVLCRVLSECYALAQLESEGIQPGGGG